MGESYGVKCNKCGYSFSAYLGVGMMFPSVYQENVEKMKSGELGPEAKEFFEKYPNGVINIEMAVAKCLECGNYDNVDDFTMYMPKPGAKVPATPEFLFENGTKKSFVKYMDYPHRCSKCGGRSKVYKSFERKALQGELKCPKCHERMEFDPERYIMWD